MTLITRCPACATMFKVVPDQLKVAHGWVRCGQCSEVFEASFHWVPEQSAAPGALTAGPNGESESDTALPLPSHDPSEILSVSAVLDVRLVELQIDSPECATAIAPEGAQSTHAAPTMPEEAAPQLTVPQAESMPAQETPDTSNVSALADDELLADSIDATHGLFSPDSALDSLHQDSLRLLEEAEADAAANAEEPVSPSDLPHGNLEILLDEPPAVAAVNLAAQQEPERIEPVFTGDDPAFAPDSPPAAEASGASAIASAEVLDAPPLAAEPDDIGDVSFIRDAQRKQFWKTPLVRTVLGLLFMLLLGTLTLQWVVWKKDVLAAQEPRLLPLLQALCKPLGCEIRPLRRIETVLIDSANFSKSGPNAYRLVFVLKNTGAAAVEIPALEVTLTDNQDQALVRRVLLPAQFGVTVNTLQAHSELAGAVTMTLGGTDQQASSAAPQTNALAVVGYRIFAFYP